MRLKTVNRNVHRAMNKMFGSAWKALAPDKKRSVIALCVTTGTITLPRGVATRYLKGLSERTTMTKKLTRLRRNAPGVEVKGKAGKMLSAVRVKDVGDKFSRKRFDVRRPDGSAVLWAGKGLETPSEYDKALCGAWLKLALLRLGWNRDNPERPVRLSETEKGLLHESAAKDGWVGTANGVYYGGGSPDGCAPEATIKGVLDDTTSGGLYLNPAVLDSSVVTYPLLHSELLPSVELVPVTGRRVMTPTVGNLSVGWGTMPGTAATPMSTAGLVGNLDTAIQNVQGWIELSNDLAADSPVDIGSTLIGLFGEKLKSELDRVICLGNGVVEPQGFANASGLVVVQSEGGVGGPLTVADFEALAFATPVQYRRKDWNCAYVMNDTSYRRARGIPVGPADERRVFGMTHMEYSLLEWPVRICNDLPNAKVFFAALRRYRLFQRAGVEVFRTGEGRSLTLANSQLLGLRARFGGRVIDANGFALMQDAQN